MIIGKDLEIDGRWNNSDYSSTNGDGYGCGSSGYTNGDGKGCGGFYHNGVRLNDGITLSAVTKRGDGLGSEITVRGAGKGDGYSGFQGCRSEA